MKQRGRVLWFSGTISLLSCSAVLLTSVLAFSREKIVVPRVHQQHQDSLTVGAFNLLHLGYGTHKNYPRVARIITEHGFDVFAAVEVMKPEGAEALLQALRQASQADWELVLSQVPTGERTYKEYLAFYYRADRVQPLEADGQYCSREDLHGLNATPQACFARDEHASGADFERDPFVGHFAAEGHPLTLVAVHLVYGDQSAHNIEKRQQEAIALHREMDRMREATPQAEVVALGDFNLQLEESEKQRPAGVTLLPSNLLLMAHAFFPADLFQGDHALSGLVTGPTTVGSSSYDHLLVYQDHRAQWSAPSIIEDVDRHDTTAMALYKQEVSDHFPVQAVFALPSL